MKKKFINNPREVVLESNDGLVKSHPNLLELSVEPLFVYRKQLKDEGKVAIISGGGSGHEPLHAGYVGVGMLDAAIPGPVFTSPAPAPILAAMKKVHVGGGVLQIIKNYTGDVLNFGAAAELAEMEDIEVATVFVSDDVAVEDSTFTAGRRGVAGTLFIEKIAGASAERGDSLQMVTEIAQRTANNVRSMGVALESGSLPHSGEPSFVLEQDELEFGVGIHGEPGRARVPTENVDDIVEKLLTSIIEDLSLKRDDTVALLVNGMGGTPLLELYIAARKAVDYLQTASIEVSRSLVGNYVTSLEMNGFSITLLKLDAELLKLWDAPVEAPGLRWGR